MIEFAQTCRSIAQTPAKLRKIDRLRAYLTTLDRSDLPAAVTFLTGSPLARRDQATLGLGSGAIIAAAQQAWRFSDAALAQSYRSHGDLGAALAEQASPPAVPGLFCDRLTPASLKSLFGQIAACRGKAAAKRRIRLCEVILSACSQPVEAMYVVKIMTGDLRIGLREGLVVDAIAAAFEVQPASVRRAAMLSGDLGSVALAARTHTLEDARMVYGAPVGFMLASPIPYGATREKLTGALWIVEAKFDGIRAQVHKQDDKVRIFSRTLIEVTHSYPEVVESVGAIRGDFILDGELIAERDGHALPFRYLQARLQRKTVSPELLAEVPVTLMAFDVLAVGPDRLIDVSLGQRRQRLAALLADCAHAKLAPYETIAVDVTRTAVGERFEAARARATRGWSSNGLTRLTTPGGAEDGGLNLNASCRRWTSSWSR